MGMASKLIRGLTRKAVTRAMDQVGGKLVSRIADTSSDAPSAFHEPKRDVYRHMKDGRLAAPPEAPSADGTPADAPGIDGHDHGHDHEH